MSSINAAAISAKHRGNAEGSVRVLGQTAAVAGISGALLLALKAMVLVAPSVLPGGEGLDALGRPNAVTAPAQAAPVVFEPASSDMPIGASERTAPSITRTVVTIPNTTTKPVTAGVVTKPNTPATPSTPGTPSTPSTPTAPGTVGTVTKPVTDLVDKVAPGLGTTLGGVTGAVDGLVKSTPVGEVLEGTGLGDTLGNTTAGLIDAAEETTGIGSSGGVLGTGLLADKSTSAGGSSGGLGGALSGVTNTLGVTKR